MTLKPAARWPKMFRRPCSCNTCRRLKLHYNIDFLWCIMFYCRKYTLQVSIVRVQLFIISYTFCLWFIKSLKPFNSDKDIVGYDTILLVQDTQVLFKVYDIQGTVDFNLTTQKKSSREDQIKNNSLDIMDFVK